MRPAPMIQDVGEVAVKGEYEVHRGAATAWLRVRWLGGRPRDTDPRSAPS
jgi:hypothetical protein